MEELKPLFAHLPSVAGLEQIMFCLACEPPKEREAEEEALQKAEDGPGPPGAVRRPSRFPSDINFIWRFLHGRDGA
jgi:hypothetical protein